MMTGQVVTNALASYRANRDPANSPANGPIISPSAFSLRQAFHFVRGGAVAVSGFTGEMPATAEASQLAVAGGEVCESMKPLPNQISEFVGAGRRTVLPPSVSRPPERIGGRASPIPAHVRVTGVALSNDDHADIRRKLGAKLGKFARSIERVTVRARDVNGPRGGVDQECTMKVVLSGLPSVIVKRRDAALHVAIDEALHAVEQAVRSSVSRRRMKPLHGRSSRRSALGNL